MQHKLDFSPALSSGGVFYLVPESLTLLIQLPAADDTRYTCDPCMGGASASLSLLSFILHFTPVDVEGKAFCSRAKTWTGLIQTNGFAFFSFYAIENNCFRFSEKYVS